MKKTKTKVKNVKSKGEKSPSIFGERMSKEDAVYPKSHKIKDTLIVPTTHVEFSYVKSWLKEPILLKLFKSTDLPKTSSYSKQLRYLEKQSKTFFKKQSNADAYNKICFREVWLTIREIEKASKNRTLYVFDIARLLCGLPFGYKYLDDQVKNALAHIGHLRKTCHFYPVWRHEINNEVMLNLIIPMWSQCQGHTYMPCVILDNQEIELYTVANNYFIVKTDSVQRLEQCKRFNLRTMPDFRLVKGLAKKSVLIKEEQDYKNWVTDCWKLRGNPIWFQQANDKLSTSLLSKQLPTIRFI